MSTENFIRKASEGDVVELLEDYPQFGVSKGQRGVVITELDKPVEAYDIEVEDQQGNFVGFAYSVRPEHIANLSAYAIHKGLTYLNDGNVDAARREFALAIELRPGLIGTLLNIFGKNYAANEDWDSFTFLLRMLLEINPAYEKAKTNLAIGYINLGVRFGKAGDFENSLLFLYRAASLTQDPEVNARLRENFAATFFGLGIRSHVKRDFENALRCMRMACSYDPTPAARKNVAAACIYVAHHHIEKGDFERARDAFEEAMDAFPLDADFINTYAICLIHLGRLDDAKWEFQRALSLASDDPIIRANLEKLESPLFSADHGTNKSEFKYEVNKYSFVPIELLAQSYQQVSAGI